MAMIEKAPDQFLIDLAQHLGVSFDATAASRIEPTFWQKGMLRVFISHLAVHKEWAGNAVVPVVRTVFSVFLGEKIIQLAVVVAVEM